MGCVFENGKFAQINFVCELPLGGLTQVPDFWTDFFPQDGSGCILRVQEDRTVAE